MCRLVSQCRCKDRFLMSLCILSDQMGISVYTYVFIVSRCTLCSIPESTYVLRACLSRVLAVCVSAELWWSCVTVFVHRLIPPESVHVARPGGHLCVYPWCATPESYLSVKCPSHVNFCVLPYQFLLSLCLLSHHVCFCICARFRIVSYIVSVSLCLLPDQFHLRLCALPEQLWSSCVTVFVFT